MAYIPDEYTGKSTMGSDSKSARANLPYLDSLLSLMDYRQGIQALCGALYPVHGLSSVKVDVGGGASRLSALI